MIHTDPMPHRRWIKAFTALHFLKAFCKGYHKLCLWESAISQHHGFLPGAILLSENKMALSYGREQNLVNTMAEQRSLNCSYDEYIIKIGNSMMCLAVC